MKITEETRERVFNIRLNEAELKLIGVIIGCVEHTTVRRWCSSCFSIKGAVCNGSSDIDNLFQTIIKALN